MPLSADTDFTWVAIGARPAGRLAATDEGSEAGHGAERRTAPSIPGPPSAPRDSRRCFPDLAIVERMARASAALLMGSLNIQSPV